jgi:hypothetical protein
MMLFPPAGENTLNLLLVPHLVGELSQTDGAAFTSEKKAGVVEHPEVFDHAGLLVNGPPGMAGLPFI